MNKIDYIQQAFHEQPIVIVSGNRYCVNSLTDHMPMTKPELLEQVTDEMSRRIDFEKADFLVGEEDRGGYLCALMSFISKKPFTLIKWSPNGLAGEISVDFRNAYTEGKLYMNGVKEFSGKKAIIIEDLIDTGGTIISMVELLQKNGVEVVDIIAVAEKDDYGGLARIAKKTGIIPKVLVRFFSGSRTSIVTKRFNSSNV